MTPLGKRCFTNIFVLHETLLLQHFRKKKPLHPTPPQKNRKKTLAIKTKKTLSNKKEHFSTQLIKIPKNVT